MNFIETVEKLINSGTLEELDTMKKALEFMDSAIYLTFIEKQFGKKGRYKKKVVKDLMQAKNTLNKLNIKTNTPKGNENES